MSNIIDLKINETFQQEQASNYDSKQNDDTKYKLKKVQHFTISKVYPI